MNAQPLTEKAADRASDADLSRRGWALMTRADTAVTEDGQAILHGERHTFTLWDEVAA